MEWTAKEPNEANHNPNVVVNGTSGQAPVTMKATAGTPLTLDAAGTRDPDGHSLTYRWFFYSEAGTGIPGQSVALGSAVPIGGGVSGEGGIPSGPAGGPREQPERVTLSGEASPRVIVTPRVAGTAHIILAVQDNGTPALTSYRRVILTIVPAPNR